MFPIWVPALGVKQILCVWDVSRENIPPHGAIASCARPANTPRLLVASTGDRANRRINGMGYNWPPLRPVHQRISESKLVVILGGRAGFVYELVWETTSFTPLRLFVYSFISRFEIAQSFIISQNCQSIIFSQHGIAAGNYHAPAAAQHRHETAFWKIRFA